MIIQNRWLVPKPYSGVTVWPFIFVVDKNDTSLIAHEMVHYREQAWISPIWFLRYWLSKSFRVAAEVRAYKVSVSSGGMTVEQAASWLMQYDSSLGYEVALNLLKA